MNVSDKHTLLINDLLELKEDEVSYKLKIDFILVKIPLRSFKTPKMPCTWLESDMNRVSITSQA